MSTTKYNQEEADRPSHYTNALIHSSSPYLLQHAHNPVNWYPWDDEALRKAKEENKPLIISIGYSACHWCHVMEHESYSDPEVAEYMNEHFVSIKVDREERPDVDQIYMNASMLMTGSGGWPLNAFALPNGQPFYVLTYLPRQRWLDLLHEIVKVYNEQPKEVKEQAEALTQGIRGADVVKTPKDVTRESLAESYQGLFEKMRSSIDFVRGGFGRAPKFPMPNAWEWLLQYHYFTGNEDALESVVVTLDQMARGGIYDVLGGGFARYATDQLWRVPHFEKMLYDNAQLISLYAHAYQVTREPLYASVIKQTLGFIQREMTGEEGGFYASINADSEGEEGKFYVWTREEIDWLLEANSAKLIKDYYEISDAGNWEQGKNILYRNIEDDVFAQKQGMTTDEWHAIIDRANNILFQARSKRIRPTTDRKMLTSWNALMITGYVDAYRALGKREYLAAALKAANFLKQNMMKEDGSVWRNYMDGVASIQGLLDDYAFLAEALINLYQVTFDKDWLSQAEVLVGYTFDHFFDETHSLFFYTPDTSEHLIARKKEMEDNVLPSSNSVMAHVLYKLGIFYDNERYVDQAKNMLNKVIEQIPSAVPYFSNWAQLLGLFQKGSCEIAIMGKDALTKAKEMQVHYLQTVLFMGGAEESLPLLEGKKVSGKTIIYVCENKVCQLPVTDVHEAIKQIR